MTTPTRAGLPPEWAPQNAVMLTWPHDGGDWGAGLGAVEDEFIGFAAAIAHRQGLIIACRDPAHLAHVQARLTRAGLLAAQAQLYVAPSNDVWARDHGPLTVRTPAGGVQLLDFRFNGWGGKYPASLDDALTGALHARGAFGGAAMESLPFVVEGGNLEVDGEGTLLCNRDCLLSTTRNPVAVHDTLVRTLEQRLGITRTVWIRDADILGDDTDGHIDTLARFCDPGTIAFSAGHPEDQAQHAALLALAAQLAELRRSDGAPYRLVPLPLPAPLHDPQGRRLPATYANFLIINEAVLVPVYGDPRDEVALARLRACFPHRVVVPLPANAITAQNGGLHCASMQLPRLEAIA